MNVIKRRIKNSFNRAENTYDSNCGVQKNIALKLLGKIPKSEYSVVADFACGTGISTQIINAAFNPNKLYAIDIAENLLNVAGIKVPKAELVCADIDEQLKIRNIDLLFCNMGLQWSQQLNKTLCLLFEYLSVGGVIAFSIPLSRTFSELNVKYRPVYPSYSELLNAVKSLGDLLDHEQYLAVEAYDNALSALRAIKFVGANCSLGHDKYKGLYTQAAINNIFDVTTALTYDIGLFVLRK